VTFFDFALAVALVLIASASAWATCQAGTPAGAAGSIDHDLVLLGVDFRAAILRLRQKLELDMSAESDALKAALDAFEPKVDAFVASLASAKGAAETAIADAAADKSALTEAKDRIAALEAQIDAAMAPPAAPAA